MYSDKSKGFTLIELMIVVSILGALSYFAVPKYQNYTLRVTATTQLLAAIRPIQNALLEYTIFNGQFPSSFDDLAKIGFVNSDGTAFKNKTDFVNGQVSSVNVQFPSDDNADVILTVAFACKTVATDGCTKIAPKTLQPLTADVTARLSKQGALVFTIDPSRANNKKFKGFLPTI